MKHFILVLCCVFSVAAYAQEDSISTVNSVVEGACNKNPNNTKESCKKMVLSMANFVSANTGFYADNCRGHISDKNKENCEDAGKLIRYLDEINQ